MVSAARQLAESQNRWSRSQRKNKKFVAHKAGRFRSRKRFWTAAHQPTGHSTTSRSEGPGKEWLDSRGESTRSRKEFDASMIDDGRGARRAFFFCKSPFASNRLVHALFIDPRHAEGRSAMSLRLTSKRRARRGRTSTGACRRKLNERDDLALSFPSFFFISGSGKSENFLVCRFFFLRALLSSFSSFFPLCLQLIDSGACRSRPRRRLFYRTPILSSSAALTLSS